MEVLHQPFKQNKEGPIMGITVLGIDLAKSVFQLHGNDERGSCVLSKRLRRSELKAFIAQLPCCLIAMEACSGSHYWAREFKKLGHEVRLISPQFVKPFVKTNKNDLADAEAIAEAAVRPNMRFVPIKELWHQELQALHRGRSLLVAQKTALGNAIRGFLLEHGIAPTLGDAALNRTLAELSDRGVSEFSAMFLDLLARLHQQLKRVQQEITELDRQIKVIAGSDERAKRIQKIEGVGPMTATAILAAVPDARAFRNARQFSAWLGLVPRQRSSGSREQLLGISKRGDGYIRTLLIHGARAAVRFADKRDTRRSRWVLEKVKARGMNKATVAFANHNARIIWALLTSEQEYRAAA
jgi:transposase